MMTLEVEWELPKGGMLWDGTRGKFDMMEEHYEFQPVFGRFQSNRSHAHRAPLKSGGGLQPQTHKQQQRLKEFDDEDGAFVMAPEELDKMSIDVLGFSSLRFSDELARFY